MLVNTIVCAFITFPRLILNKINAIKAIIIPTEIIFSIIVFVIIFSFGFLGGLFITFSLIGSIPRAKAGNPSVTKLIHNSCNAVKGITIELSSE